MARLFQMPVGRGVLINVQLSMHLPKTEVAVVS